MNPVPNDKILDLSKFKGFCRPHYFFPKQQIFGSSKLKEFADDNFKFDENDRKFPK